MNDTCLNEPGYSVYLLYQKEVYNCDHAFLQSMMDWLYSSNDSPYKFIVRNKAFINISPQGIILQKENTELVESAWTWIQFNFKHLKEIYVDKRHKDTCVLVSKVSASSSSNYVWKKSNPSNYQSFRSAYGLNSAFKKSFLLTILKFKDGPSRLLQTIQLLDSVLVDFNKKEDNNNNAKNPLKPRQYYNDFLIEPSGHASLRSKAQSQHQQQQQQAKPARNLSIDNKLTSLYQNYNNNSNVSLQNYPNNSNQYFYRQNQLYASNTNLSTLSRQSSINDLRTSQLLNRASYAQTSNSNIYTSYLDVNSASPSPIPANSGMVKTFTTTHSNKLVNPSNDNLSEIGYQQYKKKSLRNLNAMSTSSLTSHSSESHNNQFVAHHHFNHNHQQHMPHHHLHHHLFHHPMQQSHHFRFNGSVNNLTNVQQYNTTNLSTYPNINITFNGVKIEAEQQQQQHQQQHIKNENVIYIDQEYEDNQNNNNNNNNEEGQMDKNTKEYPNLKQEVYEFEESQSSSETENSSQEPETVIQKVPNEQDSENDTSKENLNEQLEIKPEEKPSISVKPVIAKLEQNKLINLVKQATISVSSGLNMPQKLHKGSAVLTQPKFLAEKCELTNKISPNEIKESNVKVRDIINSFNNFTNSTNSPKQTKTTNTQKPNNVTINITNLQKPPPPVKTVNPPDSQSKKPVLKSSPDAPSLSLQVVNDQFKSSTISSIKQALTNFQKPISSSETNLVKAVLNEPTTKTSNDINMINNKLARIVNLLSSGIQESTNHLKSSILNRTNESEDLTNTSQVAASNFYQVNGKIAKSLNASSANPTTVQRKRTFANMVWPMDPEEEKILRSTSPFVVPEIIVQRNERVKSILKKNNSLHSPSPSSNFNSLECSSGFGSIKHQQTTKSSSLCLTSSANLNKKRVDFHENCCLINFFDINDEEMSVKS